MIAIYGIKHERVPSRRSLEAELCSQWLEAWQKRHPAMHADGNWRARQQACQSLAGLVLAARAGLAGELCYDANGRPFLREVCADFSITHTEGAVLCAVMRYDKNAPCRVGLDAERLERAATLPCSELAARWFSEAEREICLANPDAECFFRLWTRKEAAVKASGEGLGAMRSIDSIALERMGEAAFATYREGDLILTLCYPAKEMPPHEIEWL